MKFFYFQIFGDSDEEEAGESQGSGTKKQSYLDELGKKYYMTGLVNWLHVR